MAHFSCGFGNLGNLDDFLVFWRKSSTTSKKFARKSQKNKKYFNRNLLQINDLRKTKKISKKRA